MMWKVKRFSLQQAEYSLFPSIFWKIEEKLPWVCAVLQSKVGYGSQPDCWALTSNAVRALAWISLFPWPGAPELCL